MKKTKKMKNMKNMKMMKIQIIMKRMKSRMVIQMKKKLKVNIYTIEMITI